LALHNTHLIGPFDNTAYKGLRTPYPPEEVIDLSATYPGKAGRAVKWQRTPGLDGHTDVASNDPKGLAMDLGAWIPPEKESVLYLYAEVEAAHATEAADATEAAGAQIARLSLASPAIIAAWVIHGEMVDHLTVANPTLAPKIPYPANHEDDQALIRLDPGKNYLLIKLAFQRDAWDMTCCCETYGDPQTLTENIATLIDQAQDPGVRLMARFYLAEMYAVLDDVPACQRALEAIQQDDFATQWDVAWTQAVQNQYRASGSFLPFYDVAMIYQPIIDITPYETFWPQSTAPAEELWVLDVSDAPPQLEFAMSVLQGLVNRQQPRLYLLHTRYGRQDAQWLEELHEEGYTSRRVTVDQVWEAFGAEVKGVILYDGDIMEEIGAFHSDQLNQTNVLMMLGALHDAVPLTHAMADQVRQNTHLALPTVFDARGKWANQYTMMRWAYEELFPHMNHRILATNYPGIFLITDYLVAFKIFTFWFPEHRTLPEENLLRGILASTPPNTPIVGWWFDWMPHPHDPDHRHADAVMEWPGLLRGSYFGKVLTPSHEATNLSVHSGVAVGPHRHKPAAKPQLDPSRIYYAHVISDGDNLGEALMMRTRDLQWDKPERGSFPMGWSFAPAAARMAPPVLNYYLRTATANDLLVGGLGVGYTEPMIYLQAYADPNHPSQREALYAEYARMTDEAMGWIDTSCLWLINGDVEEEDRYARGSSGQLQGIFTGYGGGPDIASVRTAPHNVVAFHPATRFSHGQSKEALIQEMINDIRKAAADAPRPAFIEAWVLNWGWSMDMLQEVQRRLGPDFVCVRPDVLVKLYQEANL
jgi:hypothetical protein